MKIKELMKLTVLILLLILSNHTVSAISTSLIPQTGVWVRVTYPGTYTGSIGLPDDLRVLTDSGDRFYQISTTNGIVAVSLQKTDDSSDTLNVEIYKNGVLVKQASTIAPKGILEFQVDLDSLQTPTPDYDTKIAALESQVAEQNKKIGQQGNILDKIMTFLRNVLGWE